jgi:hypothetical protein
MTEYKIYKSPTKALQLMLISSLFVVIGFFMLKQPDSPKWIAWSGILFFGLGIPFGLYLLLDRRPQIIINEIGIFDRTTHKDFINWEIIQDAYLVDVHREKLICLVVDEQFEPSRKKGKFQRSVAGLSKAMGFQELNIFLGNVRVNPERLAEFILTVRTADKPQRETLIKERLPNMV